MCVALLDWLTISCLTSFDELSIAVLLVILIMFQLLSVNVF